MAPALPSIVVLCILAVQVQESWSECCNPPGTGWLVGSGLHSLYARCDDGTRPTPCCGHGRCNFFCCNCDHGCRARGRKKREGEDQYDGFQKNDGDGDGRISLEEAKKWIMSSGCGNPFVKLAQVDNAFQGFDLDQDGFLDRQEIGG